MSRGIGLSVALITAMLALSPAALAAPDPEPPPPIDWRDFVDHDGQGDHVVGEEMCAYPGERQAG